MQNIPSTISITTPTTELVVQSSILQLKFVFTRVLEFALCFAVKYWWVLHQSYITACFCMLLLVLSYIRRHYMTRSFDGISLNLALRFIFLWQILFTCALCFIPFFIITGSILSLLFYLTIALCVMTLVHCLSLFGYLSIAVFLF